MTLQQERSTVAPCICADPEVEQLRRMVADGIPQALASRILWAPETIPPAPNPSRWAALRLRLTALRARTRRKASEL